MTALADTAEKRVVHQYMTQVWGKGDAGLVPELVADDVVDHDPFPDQLPGAAGWLQAMRMVREAVPDLSVTVHELLQERDRVSVRFTASGHLAGPFLGRGAAGDAVVIRGLELQRVSGGRMREAHRLLDVRIGADARLGADGWTRAA